MSAVAAYVAQYEGQFGAVVAEESYVQTVRGSGTNQTRHLRSDMIVSVVGEEGYIAFRDVRSVDGHPVRDASNRLVGLLQTPTRNSVELANAIRAESARHNLGPVTRTINVPTLALQYLRAENRLRSDFQLRGRARVDRVPVVEVRFEERQKPGLVEVTGGALAKGTFLIDPAGGRVFRSELRFESGGNSARITVGYIDQPNVRLLVPGRMDEEYRLAGPGTPATASSSLLGSQETPSGALTVEGRATYSNHRRFTTAGRVIIR